MFLRQKRRTTFWNFGFLIAVFGFGIFSFESSFAQTKKPKPKTSTGSTAATLLPKVTPIDAAALKNLLKPKGKPLLINFWATWCEPCREEFPDLVKIGADYKDKIDLITVSLDELSEINGDVPKFLAQMKAENPAYLLKTPDESAAIAVVSKDWQGGLPFTILLNASGETVYSKQGKFDTEILRTEIGKIVDNQNAGSEFEKGRKDAENDLANGKSAYKINIVLSRHRRKLVIAGSREINLEYEDCLKFNYIKGYNSVVEENISKIFGENSLKMFLEKIKKSGRMNFLPEVVELTLTQK